MKSTGDLIREERKRRGMTQEQLANMINKSRTTITKYENGQVIPHDELLDIIEALRSPRLRLEVLGGALTSYYLDRVDLNPLATQQKAIEEMQEAIDALKRLNLINKIGPEDLTEEEREQLVNDTMMELQDVRICSNMIMISLSERYDIDLMEVEKLSQDKMISKGYQTERMGVAG